MRARTGLGAVAGAILGGWTLSRVARRRRAIDLRGRVAIVTGGSRGLGWLVARGLADRGAHLAIVARDEAELVVARGELEARGVEVLALAEDLRDPHAAHRVVDATVRRLGGVDALVNDAGVIRVGPLAHQTPEDFDEALAIHLRAPLELTLAARPYLRRSGAGRVVNIASIGGKVAVPHLAAYAASKFALVGLSDALRAELAAEGIRVTTVAPGILRTGSFLRAEFQGRRAKEYAWFARASSLPFLSMDAERAARRVVDALRHGDRELVLGLPAKALALVHGVAPGLVGAGMEVAARALPGDGGADGDDPLPGWRVAAELPPSRVLSLGERAARRFHEWPPEWEPLDADAGADDEGDGGDGRGDGHGGG